MDSETFSLCYCQSGTDYNEYVELINVGTSPVDISGYKIKAFNSLGAQFGTVSADGCVLPSSLPCSPTTSHHLSPISQPYAIPSGAIIAANGLYLVCDAAGASNTVPNCNAKVMLVRIASSSLVLVTLSSPFAGSVDRLESLSLFLLYTTL